MNVALISVSSSFAHLSKKLALDKNIKTIYHIGANIKDKESEKYHPIVYRVPYDRKFYDYEVFDIVNILISKKIDCVLISNSNIICNTLLYTELKKYRIPCFFIDNTLAEFGIDLIKTKKFLKSLDIPIIDGIKISGKEFHENFFSYTRPFVIKLEGYLHGRQTVIVTEDNFINVYYDFFSIFIDFKPRITNIGFDREIILENFVKLKHEYSYTAILNHRNWKHLGCTKVFKKEFDNDVGYNTIGMGAISIENFDTLIHEYMEKIYSELKKWGINPYHSYQRFITLKIGIDEINTPYVIGVNTDIPELELDIIIESIKNFPKLLISAINESEIPDIEPNACKISCIRIVSKDLINRGFFPPNFNKVVKNAEVYLQGCDNTGLYHAVIIGKGDTNSEASKNIYDFLETQPLRGYYYRKDIGIDI